MQLAAALLVCAAVSLAASRGQGGRVAGAFLLAVGVAALVKPVLLVRLCQWDEEEATRNRGFWIFYSVCMVLFGLLLLILNPHYRGSI
jgi:hypothetical protein